MKLSFIGIISYRDPKFFIVIPNFAIYFVLCVEARNFVVKIATRNTRLAISGQDFVDQSFM